MSDNTDDYPVLEVTREMVLAGSEMLVATMESGLDAETIAAGIFMAMMAEMEDGKIAFTDPSGGEFYRFVTRKQH